MLYYTQVVFVKQGQEDAFHAFEDQVLPLLQQYRGELIYRVRPAESSVITTTMGLPYEIHLVTFPTRADFEAYRDDPQRRQYMGLKDQSIERVILIEGTAL
ncbi:hypothetical protein GCM10028803_47590 [Larkinella knui]|uniref:DUF1330 domain-containing protein n=1 Tax=Larkinella knui TaxID=2025310 RepID=A0A3P1CPV2_9BACT|nr:DUF1330 domain-containing protein [Larkinella knui]RRB15341.1 DUF1330 domain-containing protein [Larkinella knui]